MGVEKELGVYATIYEPIVEQPWKGLDVYLMILPILADGALLQQRVSIIITITRPGISTPSNNFSSCMQSNSRTDTGLDLYLCLIL